MLLTQCPACDTTFRVTAEQIKAKSGRVRCGQCQHAFNALDTLLDALPDNIPPPATERILDHVAPPQYLPNTTTTDTTDPVERDSEWMASIGIVASPEDILDPLVHTKRPVEVVSLIASPEEAKEENLVDSSTEEPSTHNSPEQTEILLDGPFAKLPSPATTRRWPWVVGSVLLLIALGAQAVLAFRTPLAKSLPATQPAIAALCRIAHCTTRLPAQAELLSIESSDLHPDPTKAGRLLVSATLKNRAAFSQQFPYLELTLTDIADKAILRKVLPPTAYLPPNTAIANGMLPNADITVNLVIDIDPLKANGYRLYLFYP